MEKIRSKKWFRRQFPEILMCFGFSGHGYCSIDTYSMPFDEMEKYILDVQHAKEKYKDQISIYLGIEQDVLGKRF